MYKNYDDIKSNLSLKTTAMNNNNAYFCDARSWSITGHGMSNWSKQFSKEWPNTKHIIIYAYITRI